MTQRSSPLDQLKIKYNKAWLNTNLAKTPTEKHIASIHGNFTFTCIHTLRLQKRGFLYETGFLPGSHPIWVLSVLLFSFWIGWLPTKEPRFRGPYLKWRQMRCYTYKSISRPDYKPLFGKWACAPSLPGEDRESGGNRAWLMSSTNEYLEFLFS